MKTARLKGSEAFGAGPVKYLGIEPKICARKRWVESAGALSHVHVIFEFDFSELMGI